MKAEQLTALMARDLACYAVGLWPGFERAPHHERLVQALEAVERGAVKRLLISMPPRHGKSLTASQLFPAWYLGRRPDRYVIAGTYAQELADEVGRRVRALLLDPRHLAVFPGCRVSQESAAAARFATTRGGTYFGTGTGGGITGRGADLLLIDDPLKDAADAASPTIRRALQEWYASTAFTRLQPGGAVIVCATRWHEDDLTGWLLREHAAEGWRVLSMPAIAEADDDFRREGEALWPERFPLEALARIRAQVGGATWASLYQGKPAAAGGRIFKREWWGSYREAPAFDRVISAWDSAFKVGTANDYSACVTIGQTKTAFYVLGAWRGRLEFPELKKRVVELAREFSPSAIVVEDKASGQSLLQELQRDTNLPVLAIKAEGDKVLRASVVTPTLEAGRVFLPDGASWVDGFLDEISSFPAAPHDDLVDAFVHGLTYLRTPMAGQNVFDMYAAAAERVRAGKLEPPPPEPPPPMTAWRRR